MAEVFVLEVKIASRAAPTPPSMRTRFICRRPRRRNRRPVRSRRRTFKAIRHGVRIFDVKHKGGTQKTLPATFKYAFCTPISIASVRTKITLTSRLNSKAPPRRHGWRRRSSDSRLHVGMLDCEHSRINPCQHWRTAT